ncbi:hypothetical protein T02_1438 [Trichinella nativa]|uniref:Uncharacterized protein n=1 Tax=Trichinella nativa TaxID=6335 RepID=A0A0V1KKM2_9BILA|nr:hypothetical protein T02_1438 [Trichinella nativa]
MAALKNPLCSYVLLKIISCGELVIATFAFYHTYWPLDHLTGKGVSLSFAYWLMLVP